MLFLIRFIQTPDSAIFIGISVLDLFYSVCFTERRLYKTFILNKSSYIEIYPASVSGVLLVSDSTHWPEWMQQDQIVSLQLSVHRPLACRCRRIRCPPSVEECSTCHRARTGSWLQ